MRLKPVGDQVVVVFGASSGIGREVARRFARKGARVVVSARDQAELDALAAEIEHGGGQSLALAAEATDFEQVQRLADQAVATYGRIDTWVHSAAVMLYSALEETKPEEFQRVIEVNLMGGYNGARTALPHLMRSGGGALIFITSIEAGLSLPYQSAYGASKRGLRSLADVLRMELKEQGTPISVTNIMPASINTPLYSKALTRLGVKPRPVPPIYQPGMVAEAIIYAAEHPVREMQIGGAGKLVEWLGRLSPQLADQVMRPVGALGIRSTEPKSDLAPNNLYAHLPGFARARGEHDLEAKDFSLYAWLKTRPLARGTLAAGLLVGAAALARRSLHRQ